MGFPGSKDCAMFSAWARGWDEEGKLKGIEGVRKASGGKKKKNRCPRCILICRLVSVLISQPFRCQSFLFSGDVGLESG